MNNRWEEFQKLIDNQDNLWELWGKIIHIQSGILEKYPELGALSFLVAKHPDEFNIPRWIAPYYSSLTKRQALTIITATLARYISIESRQSFLDNIGLDEAPVEIRIEVPRLIRHFDTPFKLILGEGNIDSSFHLIPDSIGNIPPTDADYRYLSTECDIPMLIVCTKMVDKDIGIEFERRMRELGLQDGPPKPMLMKEYLNTLDLPDGFDKDATIKEIYELQLNGFVKERQQALDIVDIKVGHFNKAKEQN